jgi:hypothetical protein
MRMGNAILQEMRSYDTYLRNEGKRKGGDGRRSKRGYGLSSYQQNWRRQGELDRSIRQLHFRLRKGFDDYQKNKNIEEFDRMLEGRE